MPCPPEVTKLIEKFALHSEAYHAPGYNEAQLRQEFLDPLFAALGWDMDNAAGKAEAYKDVIHEDAIKLGGRHRAPDYCFRIGGTRKFFAEAKKPAERIKDDPGHAFQLRRYAWSSKLPLSILSSFEYTIVYDCRIQPAKEDKASVARVLVIHYTDLEGRWDELAGVFSKEAIEKGSFDKFAESNKKKRGTAEVDAAFLAEIESWRLDLAKNLALRNSQLDQRDLNFAVQRIIDRIIFLRIAEDRGIEDYGRLQSLLSMSDIYHKLGEMFQRADERYNSGLFHFERETGRLEPPDELTLNLAIDDKALKDIIRQLYYPDSPYEFSVLSADILGHVYEQFLGKVIKLTAGHRAQVEEKPEVRKAGGVYYTPTYIVDYIVQQTVGKLLEGKSPKQAAKLKILDPACGSGSFLIGAYQFLLDWHRDWYLADGPENHRKDIYQDRGGQWRLTIGERKRILLNNIYGVDIDPQAVEVTKLSLCLKILENANRAALDHQLKIFHKDRALPDLGANIKCGNSLIGPDFYNGHQMNLFDDLERYRINVFDWHGKDGFPEIMKSGGFDAVIGNPPYVRIQVMKESIPLEVEHYKTAYAAAATGNYDIYVVFVERGLQLLAPGGTLGFILPHKFFNAEYGAPLRSVLTTGRHLSQIVNFGSQQVFENATTYTCLLFLAKQRQRRCRYEQVDDITAWRESGQCTRGEILAEEINGIAWNIQVGPAAKIMRRLSGAKLRLKDVAHLFVGLQTDADDVFILDVVDRKRGRVICRSAATDKQYSFELSHLKPFLKGSLDIRRYRLSGSDKLLIFPYSNADAKSTLILPKDYGENYPLTWAYLLANRNRLLKRAKGKLGVAWYGYVYKKNHLRFEQPKILAPAIATGACFAWDGEGKYYFVGSGGGGGGGYGIVLNSDCDWSPLFLLGVLNSSLTTFWLKRTSSLFRGGYIALNRQYIENIPLPAVFLTEKAGKSTHDKLVGLVDQMLALHLKLATTKPGHARTVIERQIEAIDRQIDQLVYQLYELTDDEITLVEAATA